MGLEDLEKLDAAFGGVEAAKGGNFAPIPDGTKVKLVIKNQKPALVGQKQTPVIKVTCEVAEPKEYEGKKVWHDFWLTEANAKYLKRDLITLGWPGLLPSGQVAPGYKITQLMQTTDATLVNLGAEVTLGVEPYDHTDPQTGEVQPRVKNIINFFNAKYTAQTSGQAAKPQEKAPPGPAGASAPGDDVIPF